jgi:hypothetical protein
MKARKEMVRMGTKIGAALGGVVFILSISPHAQSMICTGRSF